MAVQLPKPINIYETEPGADEAKNADWAIIAAGGSLIAGGLLLLAGYRRAGTLAAASGAALALLDQQDTLRRWWNALPSYIDDVQQVIDQVQGSVENVAEQRAKLRTILDR
jgi:hypothetical protein